VFAVLLIDLINALSPVPSYLIYKPFPDVVLSGAVVDLKTISPLASRFAVGVDEVFIAILPSFVIIVCALPLFEREYLSFSIEIVGFVKALLLYIDVFDGSCKIIVLDDELSILIFGFVEFESKKLEPDITVFPAISAKYEDLGVLVFKPYYYVELL
jgi:hypothetical protein